MACTGAYTLIAPNEKRRNEIQQMAAKELEELERWKEQQRVKSITLPPMTLVKATVSQSPDLLNVGSTSRIKSIVPLIAGGICRHMHKSLNFTQVYTESLLYAQVDLLELDPRERHYCGELQNQGSSKLSQPQTLLLFFVVLLNIQRVNNAFLDRLQGKSQPGGLQNFGGYWNMNSGNSWGFSFMKGFVFHSDSQQFAGFPFLFPELMGIDVGYSDREDSWVLSNTNS
ncbi:hypothetical protein MJG53_009763 [Ovis ammon polii x Ovis aries]|uniref:Uncharacterized protein n=1 Tax=Ovis ammon polii x Ovis aries TaxID=2918886 RepID=A0ACB9UVM5_9CETA|nr:hypothetical protein MJG53_009763 [Ovis ammon polii x Ovis aries]